MDRIVYTATMARHARRAAEIILGERPTNKGRVDLREILSLVSMSRNVDNFLIGFTTWHRMMVDSANTAAGKLMSRTITDEPPFVVCGQLNEFADAVDGMVALANTLNQAAALIQQHGHLKNRVGNLNTGFCVLSAIEHIIKDGVTNHALRHGKTHAAALWTGALQAITQEIGSVQIVAWNDSPRTSAEDVMRVLHAAASHIITIRP